MPIVNWIVKKIRKGRKLIIDLPDIPPETRDKVVCTILEFASKTISDSIAKTASNEISKTR
jgi:hypothetical protein